MKLSIVMPVLDEAERIVEQLTTLAPLRASGVELVVVDGGSTDATVTLAAPHADRVLTSARGRARQMNSGAAAASGDVLVFLHADTRLPADADKLIMEGLASTGKIWGRFDVAIDGRSPLLPVVAALMNLRSRITGIATGDQAIFVTRAAFVEAGGYPDQPLMEDIELSKRLRARRAPLCLKARAVTSGRRWETRGVWRTIILMWSLRLAYFLGTSPEPLAKRYR